MFDNFQNIAIFKSNEVAGVNICLLPDGGFDIAMLLLKKKKSQVHIARVSAALTGIEELKQLLPQSVPVCLAIDGKGIIHKKVNASDDIDDGTALNLVLPNVQADDFIVQKTAITAEQLFLSVVRKDHLSHLLEELKNGGIVVIDVHLGPFPIADILFLFKEAGDNLYTKQYDLVIKNSVISEIKKQESPVAACKYKLGSDELNEETILAFACAYNYLSGNRSDAVLPEIKTQREDHFYKKFFSVLGWSALIFFFVLLLANFLLFSHYNKKSNDLSAQLSVNKDLLVKLDTLTGELAQKEKFLEKSGFLSSSKLSFYSDRIGCVMHDGLILTKIEINPLEKKLKQDKEAMFKQNCIRIAGLAKESTMLNDWIKTLKKESWIAEVKIVNYVNKGTTTAGEFELELKIK